LPHFLEFLLVVVVYWRFSQDFSFDVGLPQVISTCVLVSPSLTKPDPQRKAQALQVANDKKRIDAKRIIVLSIFIFYLP
jgi:hypothetical protein